MKANWSGVNCWGWLLLPFFFHFGTCLKTSIPKNFLTVYILKRNFSHIIGTPSLRIQGLPPRLLWPLFPFLALFRIALITFQHATSLTRHIYCSSRPSESQCISCLFHNKMESFLQLWRQCWGIGRFFFQWFPKVSNLLTLSPVHHVSSPRRWVPCPILPADLKSMGSSHFIYLFLDEVGTEVKSKNSRATLARFKY